MTSVEAVKEFHEVFGHPVNTVPKLLDMKRATLRVDLIAEELDELREAIICGDLVEVADALTDIRWVTEGAALEYGIDIDACTKEVHRSNMSKLGADGNPIYREDGKILKGPSYSEPDLLKVLNLNMSEV